MAHLQPDDLLAYAVTVWSSALASYGASRVISLDISEDFGCVWHRASVAKLQMFGLHHTLIKWIDSFLFCRLTAIRADSFLSNLQSVNAGAPQDSVTSPVLFILFINDLLTSTSSSNHSLLMIPSEVLHFHSIQMTMLPSISNVTEEFQPLFSPII